MARIFGISDNVNYLIFQRPRFPVSQLGRCLLVKIIFTWVKHHCVKLYSFFSLHGQFYLHATKAWSNVISQYDSNCTQTRNINQKASTMFTSRNLHVK